ncbi:4-hydroxybenzoate polyprenyltransferase [Nocardioides lianchengensis]|uniref:4-hydroxybenzoate polyprenyltransferase n=1 Tax=Nocardioides lianchengensis TaxID=1045774 RepID=A0A1G7BKG6_9ACTN|nr:4-hydroxybenzoate polyprenyltransferase [Nocardioides lianchengensis]
MLGLLQSSHPGPAVAVSLVATLLAVAADQPPGTVALVGTAVASGQLTVGWGNDLVDVARDRATGRPDKPIARGLVPARLVAGATGIAAVACLVLSLALGWRAALAHLTCLVLAHAYNLGLKTGPWSWLPYAGAFGLLPAVATAAEPATRWPAWWAVAAGAALGVGAHLVNALPDLADDERTGVRGLPHRLGAARARVAAAVLLAAASVLATLGPGDPPAWAFAVLVAVALLSLVALRGAGRWPFRAAMAVALLDVVLLVASGA